MKNDITVKNDNLQTLIDELKVRATATEKLSTDSDLFGLPGKQHVVNIKLAALKENIEKMESENT